MELREFAEYHAPALERDEARHNLMLGLLARLLNHAEPNPDVRLWTLGASGQCAMQTSPRNAIILGELDERQCRAFEGGTNSKTIQTRKTNGDGSEEPALPHLR